MNQLRLADYSRFHGASPPGAWRPMARRRRRISPLLLCALTLLALGILAMVAGEGRPVRASGPAPRFIVIGASQEKTLARELNALPSDCTPVLFGSGYGTDAFIIVECQEEQTR